MKYGFIISLSEKYAGANSRKINKIILGEYIWLCQKEDNQSLEVKREGLITNLV